MPGEKGPEGGEGQRLVRRCHTDYQECENRDGKSHIVAEI